MRKVAETTSSKNRINVLVTFLKSVSPMKAKSSTIAIFIKLFATRIVASSFFGRSSSDAIICIADEFSSSPLSMLDLVNEKSATSAPDIRAEHANSITSNIILVINDVLVTNKFESKTEGSGSKIKLI